MFEGSKGSLAKMFWKILFLALMIGEYEKAAWQPSELRTSAG